MGKGGPALQPVADQTVAERRALRTQYRQLHIETVAGKENLINGGSELQAMLLKANSLHKQVARPREHAVDAEVFAHLTECSFNLIRRSQASNQGRTPGDLISALRMAFVIDSIAAAAGGMHEDAFDWAAMGGGCSGMHKSGPGVNCMRGPLAAEARARHTAVRQARQAVGSQVQPKELEVIQENEKQETDRNYQQMWGQLRAAGAGRQQIPFIRLVCNHSSFAQTVENIFTLSFLVRDQRVKLLPSDSGLLVLAVSSQERATLETHPGSSTAQQFMMTFTMEDWRIMRRIVQPAECIMPTRGKSSSPSAAAISAGPSNRKRAREQ